jgi:hypothetical protein
VQCKRKCCLGVEFQGKLFHWDNQTWASTTRIRSSGAWSEPKAMDVNFLDEKKEWRWKQAHLMTILPMEWPMRMSFHFSDWFFTYDGYTVLLKTDQRMVQNGCLWKGWRTQLMLVKYAVKDRWADICKIVSHWQVSG